ncbi:tropomyosin-like isoform X2 [Narcine bancroftii]|uniref:tropomyosin-like isoform X2 n=1 Tax=Narcine bancroftii TaxID=1343680 RepID=UPI003831182B
MGCQSGEIASDGTWEKFATMRSRKGKSGQRGEDTSAGKQDEAASPSAPAGLTLLWACLLLLVAGSGVGGWYLQQQLRTIGSLEQSVQILHRKLSQLETIHSQVAELNEKLMITETHEQKLQDLKIAWTDAERKMDKATEAVAQIQSADLESKVSRLQSEMSKGLNELRKDLLTKKDLEHLEHMVEVLREVDFAHANQEVTTVKIATLKLKENVDSLSVSLSTLTSRVAGLEAKSKDLETLQQSVEDISTVKELMDHSLPQLSNGVIALTKQVNQTAQVIDVIQSQLVQDSKELSALKGYTLGQQVEHLSIKEELENIRKMAYNLQMEKIPMEVVENAIRSSVAGDIRELQNHTSKMDEILVNLQNDIIKIDRLTKAPEPPPLKRRRPGRWRN